MAEMARIVVVGCGYWGRNHVRTLNELGALAGVADADQDLAAQMAASHGVDPMSVEEALDGAGHDGVVLALPAQLHAPMAIRALDGGKHVFVEKPIALSHHDANAVVEAAADAKRVLMTGHILVYHNAFRTIMDQIVRGAIGTVRHIQSHRLGFGKFHARFDAVWDLAPHDLSMVLSVAGSVPQKVSSHPVSMTGTGQCDAAHIHMSFAGGLTAHVHVSRHSPYVERRLVVTGERGMLIWDDTADWPDKVKLHRHEARFDGRDWHFSPGTAEALPCTPNMALTDELAHFLDCIANNTGPLTSGAQGRDVVRVLAAASANQSPSVTRDEKV